MYKRILKTITEYSRSQQNWGSGARPAAARLICAHLVQTTVSHVWTDLYGGKKRLKLKNRYTLHFQFAFAISVA